MSKITNNRGVIWITGLSGSGKSTVAYLLAEKFRLLHDNVIVLDGDQLRKIFSSCKHESKAFNRRHRLELAKQYSKLCHNLSCQGALVIIATISLFREVHSWNRENIEGYVEVFLRVPIDELRKRDPKGIYKGYDEGRVSNIAGIDLAIDEPEFPDYIFEFDPRIDASSLTSTLFADLTEESR